MSRKVVIPEKNCISVDNTKHDKVYIFINHGNIYKSNFITIGNVSGFAFFPIFGSCCKIKYFHTFLSWSIKLAIGDGNNVYEVEDESELIDFIISFYNENLYSY